MEWTFATQERAKERGEYARKRAEKHLDNYKRFSFLKNVTRISSLVMAFAVSTLSMAFREGNGSNSVLARTTTGAAGYLLTLVLAVEAYKRYSERSILHEQAAEEWEELYQDIGDTLAQEKDDPDRFLSELRNVFASLREKYPAVRVEGQTLPPLTKQRKRSVLRKESAADMV